MDWPDLLLPPINLWNRPLCENDAREREQPVEPYKNSLEKSVTGELYYKHQTETKM